MNPTDHNSAFGTQMVAYNWWAIQVQPITSQHMGVQPITRHHMGVNQSQATIWGYSGLTKLWICPRDDIHISSLLMRQIREFSSPIKSL